MSESVDILIKAEDMATPVINNAAKAVDGLDTNIKKIKESGQQAKKSTDFFKIIANSLGGTEIGSYVSQLGEAADKTSQFAEVQKAGGAGALAFKAGLVVAAGALAFQFGQAIGNAIFQTDMWIKKLADAQAQAEKLNSAFAELKDFNFGRDREEISLIQDPDEQLAATKSLLLKIEGEIRSKQESINALRKSAEDPGSIWSEEWADTSKATRAELNKQIADGEKFIEVLQKQTLELKRSTDETAIRIKARKEELKQEEETKRSKEDAAKKAIADQESVLQGSANYVKSLREQLDVMKATDEQRAGVMAAQKAVGGDVAEAEGILKEMEAIKAAEDAKRKADDAQKKADQDKEQAALKIVQLKESELQRLEQERILLTQGAEAAKVFALQKQGLSKEDATSIAKQEAELERMKKKQEMLNKPAEKPEFEEIKGAGPIVASESRLLKRGASDDPTVMVAKNTNKMIEQNEALREEIRLMTQELAEIKENSKMELEAVA